MRKQNHIAPKIALVLLACALCEIAPGGSLGARRIGIQQSQLKWQSHQLAEPQQDHTLHLPGAFLWHIHTQESVEGHPQVPLIQAGRIQSHSRGKPEESK